MSDTKPTGLALLREPFPAHQISKLPKPTKEQTQAVKDNFKLGIRCKLCGAWHHPDVVHLDYVGHAALTDRLLDADPAWAWEPLGFDADGLPKTDRDGGLWIKLIVCGVARFGYGHAGDKKGGDAVKEVIGDALRNAAMRFGAALDLWHKGQLHLDEEDEKPAPAPKPDAKKAEQAKPSKPRGYAPWVATMEGAAKRGTDDLRIAYGLGNKEVAAYLNEHEPDVLTALQDTAKQAKPAASAA